jgi:hypothetical protein
LIDDGPLHPIPPLVADVEIDFAKAAVREINRGKLGEGGGNGKATYTGTHGSCRG